MPLVAQFSSLANCLHGLLAPPCMLMVVHLRQVDFTERRTPNAELRAVSGPIFQSLPGWESASVRINSFCRVTLSSKPVAYGILEHADLDLHAAKIDVLNRA